MYTDETTEKIIGCGMKVSNALGVGFLEKVHENALALELRRSGLKVDQQKCISVRYEGVIVGDYAADMIVEGTVLVELKAAKFIDRIHEAQILNYLRASGIKVGLILNFGTPKLGIKRMIL
jgi:GxxExxY protein